MQPAGRFLGEDYPPRRRRAGRGGGADGGAACCRIRARSPSTARRWARTARGKRSWDREVIRAYDKPIVKEAGFLNLKGNLFNSAIMKTSVISEEFRKRYLSNPSDPDAFEGRAVVFDGREDYHARINDPSLGIDENTHPRHPRRRADRLSGRRRGGEHAAARRAPAARHQRAALHRRRPAVRHVRLALDPQRLAGGGGRRRAGAGADRRPRAHRPEEARRRTSSSPTRSCRSGARRCGRSSAMAGSATCPQSQTPWQEIQRDIVGQFDEGMVLKPAVKYRDVAHHNYPRDNH